MLGKFSKKDTLKRLEREANDDFHLLNELGPAQFDTEHLLELLDSSRARLRLFQRRQKLAMMLGGTAAGWVFMGLLAHGFHFAGLALVALGIATVSILGFFFIIVWQKWRFESQGELEYDLRSIEEELKHRQSLKRRPL